MVPILILHAKYHKPIEDSALVTSLITEQNGQMHDVPNRSTSLYEAYEIFSFSPKKNRVDDLLSQNFRIDTDFFRSNTGKSITTIEIDFDYTTSWLFC
ncbi:hypothetical protein G3O08_19135 [Cryomorpha ignava]|uniref:Uncharacterized protein n=1 Tax=Cryomorpha ignava TaxID=101383 RepID=A0A7K3WX18_9FLAO|nr:hypothetical protein [Cryomorpha ignava]NEN25611.1 hypothetical protein [Cryomorpha ignava]